MKALSRFPIPKKKENRVIRVKLNQKKFGKSMQVL
jgi:hypothetical protein